MALNGINKKQYDFFWFTCFVCGEYNSKPAAGTQGIDVSTSLPGTLSDLRLCFLNAKILELLKITIHSLCSNTPAKIW